MFDRPLAKSAVRIRYRSAKKKKMSVSDMRWPLATISSKDALNAKMASMDINLTYRRKLAV